MKRLLTVVLLSCVAVAVPAATLVVVRADGVAVHFTVELALTPDDRAQGLMKRSTLAPRHGMWFDFEREAPVSMWMKDTLIPLDMAFFDAARRLVHLRRHTEPGSLERIAPPQPVRFVLELNAGESADYGLAVGGVVSALRD